MIFNPYVNGLNPFIVIPGSQINHRIKRKHNTRHFAAIAKKTKLKKLAKRQRKNKRKH